MFDVDDEEAGGAAPGQAQAVVGGQQAAQGAAQPQQPAAGQPEQPAAGKKGWSKTKRLVVAMLVVFLLFSGLMVYALTGAGKTGAAAAASLQTGGRTRGQGRAGADGRPAGDTNTVALNELEHELNGRSGAGDEKESAGSGARLTEDYFANAQGESGGEGDSGAKREGGEGGGEKRDGQSGAPGGGGLVSQINEQKRREGGGGQADEAEGGAGAGPSRGGVPNNVSVRYAPLPAREVASTTGGVVTAVPAGGGTAQRRESSAGAEAEAIPPFGTKIPVSVVGSFFAPSSSDAVVMLSVATDVGGEGWGLPRGTLMVGRIKGVVARKRVEVSVFGYVLPSSNRLVRVTGDALGDEGGTGLRGELRNTQSILARFGRGAMQVASNVGAGFASGYVFRSAVPVLMPGGGADGSGYGGGASQANQVFVEVGAGTSGFVLIKTLPGTVPSRDADVATQDGRPADAGETELLRQIRDAREAEGRLQDALKRSRQ